MSVQTRKNAELFYKALEDVWVVRNRFGREALTTLFGIARRRLKKQ